MVSTHCLCGGCEFLHLQCLEPRHLLSGRGASKCDNSRAQSPSHLGSGWLHSPLCLKPPLPHSLFLSELRNSCSFFNISRFSDSRNADGALPGSSLFPYPMPLKLDNGTCNFWGDHSCSVLVPSFWGLKSPDTQDTTDRKQGEADSAAVDISGKKAA